MGWSYHNKPPMGWPLDYDSGLVPDAGFWSFNESSGNTVQDLSGNGNDGTITGAAWTSGKFGSCLSFDGADSNNSVAIEDNDSLKLTDSTAGMTVSFWVKYNPTALGNRDTAIAKGYPHGTSGGWNHDYAVIKSHADDKMMFSGMYNQTSVLFSVYSATVVTSNVWYYVVGTWDGTTNANAVKIYMNGVFEDSATANDTIDKMNAHSSLFFSYPAASFELDGLIDHAMIYNRALTASEIAKLYREPFCMFEPSLTVAQMYDYSGAIGTTYYVATDGNDADTGGIGDPFLTIGKAQTVVRDTGTDGHTVILRGAPTCTGIYYVTSSIAFTDSDSGASGQTNSWQAYTDETVYIRGSKSITIGDFSTYSGNVVVADLSSYGIEKGSTDPCQVFLNGTRLRKARFPNFDASYPVSGGHKYVASDTSGDSNNFKYTADDIDSSAWTNLDEVEVSVVTGYWARFGTVSSINSDTRVVTLVASVGDTISATDRYFFKNIFEELDAANEWYFNDSNELYLYPPSALTGSDVLTVDFVEDLFTLNGTQYMAFDDLNFGECQGEAITIHDANFVIFTNCDVKNCELEGYDITDGNNVDILDSEISYTGNWGIYAINASAAYFKPLLSSNYVFSGNTIHDTGFYTLGSYGGAIYAITVGTEISSNTIYSTPRCAINFNGNNFTIEYNYIHDTMEATHDGGAIYQVARSWVEQGNTIQWNYIEDTTGYGWDGDSWESPYYAYGIYLDDWAGGATVRKNTIVRASAGGFFIHGGRDIDAQYNTIVDCGESGGYQAVFGDGAWPSAYLATMWTELSDVNTSSNDWDGSAYHSAYSGLTEIVDVNGFTIGGEDQNDVMGNVTFKNNVIVYPNYTSDLYYCRRIEEENCDINDNVVWAGTGETIYASILADPPGNYGQVDWTTTWMDKGFDGGSVDVNDFTVPPGFDYVLYMNNTAASYEYNLGGREYQDPNETTLSGMMTLTTFESRVLFPLSSDETRYFIGY